VIAREISNCTHASKPSNVVFMVCWL
jgi:hypothetical protein